MAQSLTALHYYPWQVATAQQWLGQQERFSHAWLLHGLAGIGKVQFAKAGAAALLCEQPVNQLACGHCASCQWVLTGNHPDLRLIRPEAIMALEEPESVSSSTSKTPSKHIRVEQLRELTHWFNTATHRGGYRIAIIYPAESLNLISANTLLKVLEEPPAQTVFLVVADHYERLLPTIISRCRRLPLATPTQQQSVEWLTEQSIAEPASWLAAASGAPLAAYRAAQSNDTPYPNWLPTLCEYVAQGRGKAIVQLAPQLEAMSTSGWIDVLQRLYVDIQLIGQHLSPRYYPTLQPLITKMAERSSPQAVQQQWKWLITQKHDAEHPLNVKFLVHTALERLAHSSSGSA